MKKGLKILALALIAIMLFSAIGYAAEQIVQAYVSPHFKVILDGAPQTFKDANGNVVYPVVIDGTTYLPLRSVSSAFGKDVNWDADTTTITIGASGPANLIDVTTDGEHAGLWGFKIQGEQNLTFDIGDTGVKYQTAFQLRSVNSAAKTATYSIDGSYSTLNLDLLFSTDNEYANKAIVKITNTDTNVDIVNQEVEAGEIIHLTDVNITGVSNITFSANTINVSAGNDSSVYFLSPTVK